MNSLKCKIVKIRLRQFKNKNLKPYKLFQLTLRFMWLFKPILVKDF